MSIRHYRDLIVWQKSIDLVVMVYRSVKVLPREELYSLSDQIRRAAVSIPSNIAEGQQRTSAKDFIRFLSIARGSLAELETQFTICERLNYLTGEQIEPIMAQCAEISKMLNSLLKRLNDTENKDAV